MSGSKPNPGDASSRVPRVSAASLMTTARELNDSGVEFLKIDTETALIFAKIALQTNDPAKRKRNRENARKAYDTIQRLAKKLSLTSGEETSMNERLDQLRRDLMELDESF